MKEKHSHRRAQLTEIHDSKRETVRLLENVLTARRNGDDLPENARIDYPMVEGSVYLTIYLDAVDAVHRHGFIIEYDELLLPVAGKYFSANGASTYRESEMNSEEFRTVVEYYGVKDADIKSMITEKLRLL